MPANMKLGPILGLLLVCAMTIFIFGLDAAQDKKTTTSPPPKSGAGTYKEYCAVCHGKIGKGDGPAASALKVRSPDLTTLARRHDGKFPDACVAEVLRNGVALTRMEQPKCLFGDRYLCRSILRIRASSTYEFQA